MTRVIAVLMAVALGGCTVARMADFGTVGESDRIDVTNVPGWANGTFGLGAARGSVRRLAATDALGWGPDVIGSAFDNVKVGIAARYGTIAFVLDSKDVGGRLEGRCRYARTEVRDHVAGLDLAMPAQPLALRCAYRVDDRPVGQLELEAVASARLHNAEPRTGAMRYQGAVLDLRSTHANEGISIRSAEPIGYVLERAGGKAIAAVDLNGLSHRRLLMPRAQPERAASVAAMLTLASFWSPGNVG